MAGKSLGEMVLVRYAEMIEDNATQEELEAFGAKATEAFRLLDKMVADYKAKGLWPE